MNQPAQQRRQPPPRPQNNAQPASANGASGSSQQASQQAEAPTRRRRSAEERLAEEERKQAKKQREIEKSQRKIDDLRRQDQVKKLTELIAKSEDKDLKKKARRAVECERVRGTLYDAQEILEDMDLPTDVIKQAIEQVVGESAQHMAELQEAVG